MSGSHSMSGSQDGPEDRILMGEPVGPLIAIRELHPGYFALVMATGIIAIGAHLHRMPLIDHALFVVAAGGYVTLTTLSATRLVLFPQRFVGDLTSHAEGFAFTTAVAASNVLGGAAAVLYGWWGLAKVLWIVGIIEWVVLLYTSLVAVVLKTPKPGLATGINGTWFLLTVSTESIVALGAFMLRRNHSELLAFVCIALFCLGIVLYLIVMTMVFLRWSIRDLAPSDAEPPVAIAAGAVAITVVAGSHLLMAARDVPRVARIESAIEVLILTAWTTATFWLPLIAAIAIWRHVIIKVPVRYDPSWWAVIFPLGMYSVATYRLDQAVELSSLRWISSTVLLIAVVVWTLAFAGLLHRAARAAGAMARGGRSPAE